MDADQVEHGDLWSAYQRGEPYTGGVIDGAALRHLLLTSPDPPLPGHQAALRLNGVTITGPLDLRDVSLSCTVNFEACTFTDAVELENFTVPTLSFNRCRLRGINADRLTVARVLRVTESVVDGTVWLRDARIGAHVDLTGSTVTPTGYIGDRPKGGSLAPGYIGIDAECIVVGGDFHAELLTCRGAIILNLARLEGVVTFTDADVPDGCVHAPSLRCAGFHGRGRFRLHGMIDISRSEINGPVDLSGASIINPGKTAFDGSGTAVSGVFAADESTMLSGTLDLHAATIGGGLRLSGMTCREPGVHGSLHLARSVVSAGVMARECVLDGTVNLSHTQIAASVELEGVRVKGAVNADNIAVSGDFDICKATLDDVLTLRGARVIGTVCLEDTRLTSLLADGLNAFQVNLQQQPPPGVLELSHATVEVLWDNAGAWPQHPILDAFVYRQLRNDLPIAYRLEVLRRATPTAQPQPYEQLAAVYRASGQERKARQVLREKLRREARAGHWMRRIWGAVQDLAIGYGYLPGRAATVLAGILIAGTLFFRTSSCAGRPGLCPIKPAEHPTWDPFLYTLDTLVPIVDLGHETAFDPTGWDKTIMIAVMASGWVFATTIIAAAGRSLSRQ